MKKWLLSVAVLSLVGITFISCNAGPKPEIVGVTATDGAPGFDYTVWVECTVRNNGSSGNINVVAELNGGGAWRKRDTIYVEGKQERKVTLAFPEATFIGTGLSGYQYNCRTE